MQKFADHGITSKQYFKIIREVTQDGWGRFTQDGLSLYLDQAMETGSLTEAQAEVVWESMQWGKSLSEGIRVAKSKASAMKHLKESGIRKRAYKKALSKADENDDNSISQQEMYSFLESSGYSQDVKDAFWAAQGWTKPMEDVGHEILISDMKAAAFAEDTAAFNEALSEYSRTAKAKTAYSAVKSFVRKAYMGDDLSGGEYAIVGESEVTDVQARRMLHYYAGMSVDDAVETVSKWKAERAFVQEHGDEYDQYGLTVSQAQFYYSAAKSKVSLEKYSGQVEDYGMDRVKAFYGTNGWADTGLSIEQYDSYATSAAKCKGTDNDGDGKTDAYSVMYQKFAIINALPVSKAIKDAICRKEGWADRNIATAPWH